MSMVKAWKENQKVIHEYFENKEMFTYTNNIKDKELATILGISVGVFVFLFIVSTILFVWGLYLLIVYWDKLPTWAAVVGIIGLFFFPLITVIVVYAIKDKEDKGEKKKKYSMGDCNTYRSIKNNNYMVGNVPLSGKERQEVDDFLLKNNCQSHLKIFPAGMKNSYRDRIDRIKMNVETDMKR